MCSAWKKKYWVMMVNPGMNYRVWWQWVRSLSISAWTQCDEVDERRCPWWPAVWPSLSSQPPHSLGPGWSPRQTLPSHLYNLLLSSLTWTGTGFNSHIKKKTVWQLQDWHKHVNSIRVFLYQSEHLCPGLSWRTKLIFCWLLRSVYTLKQL